MASRTQSSNDENETKGETQTDNTKTVDGSTSIQSKTGKTKKIIQTCGLYLVAINAGVFTALIGAILLEIQIQVGSDLDQLSLLFTWICLGSLLSTIFVGLLFEKLHPEFQLGIVSLIHTACQVILPFLKSYASFSAVMFILGFGNGYIAGGLHAHVFSLWSKETGPFLQAAHCIFSVGSILAPIIAKPFLTPNEDIRNISSSNMSYVNATLSFDPDLNRTTSSYGNEMENAPLVAHRGTFYPFIISACTQLPAVIVMLAITISDKCKLVRGSDTKIENKCANLHVHAHKPVLCLFLFMVMLATGAEVTLGGLLYTYCVQHLEWTTEKSNTLVTVFWAVYATARALGIVLLRYMRPLTILIAGLGGLCISLSILTAANQFYIVFWTFTVTMSLSLALLYTNIMLRSQEYFEITGLISALWVVMMNIGGAAVPALVGFLADRYGFNWLFYVLLIITFLFISALVIIKMIGRKYTEKDPAANVTK